MWTEWVQLEKIIRNTYRGLVGVCAKKCLVRETSSGMCYATAGASGAAPALALRASGSHLGFESNCEHALLFARYVVVGQAI